MLLVIKKGNAGLHWCKVLIVCPYGGHFAQQKAFVYGELMGGCLKKGCIH